MLSYLSYLAFRFAVLLFKAMPYKLMYLLSDVLAWVFNKVIKYRRGVVLDNLNRSFPDLTKEEIEQLVKAQYRNFTDIFLESFKGFSMSKAELLKRWEIINPELTFPAYEAGKSLIVQGSHYANWEWGVMCVNLQVKHPLTGIYKPLGNPHIDKYFRASRCRFGMRLAPLNQTTHTFDQERGGPHAVIMMADQSPSNAEKSYWMEFLGRPTACLHGPEKHAKRKNMATVYFAPRRIKRGFYQCELISLVEEPSIANEGEITKTYMQRLEQILLADPSCWLWTHKRWKKELPADPKWI